MKGRGGHLFDAGKARQAHHYWEHLAGHWTLDTGHWTGSPFIFSPSTESYAAWVHDINNDDDGVLKCRFTITVFLPPCNVRPVYLLPPSPFSPVSQNSHLPPHSAPLCLECGRVGRLWYFLMCKGKVSIEKSCLLPGLARISKFLWSTLINLLFCFVEGFDCFEED